MKKIIYAFAIILIGTNLTSCAPEALTEEPVPQACCGDDIPIPPPRP